MQERSWVVFVISAATIFLRTAPAQNQSVQAFPLNSYVRSLDGQWEGIRYASDGNVYFASSSQSAHHGAAFFKYSPATAQVTLLAADITAICGEDPATNPQGKIHADIKEMNGWLFFTTHFGADERPNGITGWTGGHLVGYRFSDTGSNNYFNTPVGSFHDYGVIYPNYTSYSGIAVDPVQNYVYVYVTGEVSPQVSYVFRYNAATDTQATRATLGAASNQSYAASLYWFTDAVGDIWFAVFNDNGALQRIHHDTGMIQRYDNVLPPFIRQDSNTVDPLAARNIQWMAQISGTKAVFTYQAGGMLYQFDSSQATATGIPPSAFTNLKWIGPSYIGSAANSNRVFWYQRAGGAIGHQGCDAADTTLPPTCQDYHLLSVPLDPAAGYPITDHGLIKDQSGRTVWRIPAMATDSTNANVYMVGDWWTYDTSGNPIPGDAGVNNTLRYRYDAQNGGEYFVDEPRGEFFGVAHINITLSPDLTIVKSHSGSFTPGQTGATYTLTVTNSGTAATNAPVSVSDTVPSGLTATSIAGPGWTTCTQPAGPCTRTDVLGIGQSYPPLTLTVNVASNAPPNVTNTATVSGGGETNTGNNTANDPTTILLPGAFITGVAVSGRPLRNNFSGFVGLQFTVGASALSVSSLGRFCVAGNSGMHTVKLVNAGTGTDVAGGTAQVSMAGCTAGQFQYASLANAVTLSANTPYYLASLEALGGDQWYDHGPVSSTTVAAVTSSVYFNGANWLPVDGPNTSYVPPNFQYGSGVKPPTIGKTFGASSIAPNGTTSLSFTITNPNGGTSLTGVGFTDTLPGGLVVATPNGLSGSCGGGTITAAAGSGSISLSGATLAGSASCTFAVNVTATSNGSKINTTGNVTSNEANGGTASASITVGVLAPTISKSFGASSIALNSTTSLSFTITNPNSGISLTGIGFADTLPSGLVVATPNGLSGSCGGGTITAVPGSGSISLSGAALTGSGSCTFAVNVQGTSAGVKNNTTGNVTANESGNGNTASASITVGNSFLTGYALDNPGLRNDFGSFVGMQFTVGGSALSVSALGRICVAGNSGPHTIKLVSAGNKQDVPGGSVSVNMAGCTAGQFRYVGLASPITLQANTGYYLASLEAAGGDQWYNWGAVASTTAGSVNNAIWFDGTNWNPVAGANSSYVPPNFQYGSGVLPPTIGKTFGTSSIAPNGTTSLSFTIGNPNSSGTSLTGVGFTDSLPSGLVVATPNGLSGSCGGGTIAAAAGSGSISLSGATLAGSASCTFAVNVTATSGGPKNNTTGNVTSNEGGTGNAASASITVVAPPTISKSFGASSIALNSTTSLSFTITNPNSGISLTGVGFTDSLPSGLVVATPNGLSGSCGGGTITAAAGSGSISLSGATLAGSASCTFAVNVTGTTTGLKNNTTGNVTSNEGGNGGAATASITVGILPPTIGKSFGASSIALNDTTSLSFTITNPNSSGLSLTGVSFTDSLPAGLVVATPTGLSGSCGGGTITAVSGSGSISLSGAALSGSTSCTFAVNVTGASLGPKANTTGNVTSNEGGNGNVAMANITVVNGNGPVPFLTGYAQDNSSLRNDFGNFVGMQFTVGANALSVSALGRICVAGNSGTHMIKLVNAGSKQDVSGGSVSVNMAGCTAGQFKYVGLLSPVALPANTGYYLVSSEVAGGDQWYNWGAVASTSVAAVNNAIWFDGLNWNPVAGPNSSYVPPNFQYSPVVSPPTISKSFGASTIPPNGTTSLSFTIGNPNGGTSLTGVGFTDSLPSGLVVATPNGLSGSCGGGTITAVAGSGSISLSGAALSGSASCMFTVNVKGTGNGPQNNTTGNVTSNEGGNGNTAMASITVAMVTAPTIAKSFGASIIALNGTTSLSFTITNPNTITAIPLTGVGFTDTLPGGLVVATPNGLSGSCGGGTITAVAGSGSISLSGATVTTSSASCAFAVNVTGTSNGPKNNTTSNVTSNEGGNGTPASASVTVGVAPPIIAESFGAPNIALGGTTSLTFTITNPNPNGVTLTGVAFTDSLPGGLVVATPNGLSVTCGGAMTFAANGSGSISLSGATLGGSASCTFAMNVTGTRVGVEINTTGNVTANESVTGLTASASITVGNVSFLTGYALDNPSLRNDFGNFVGMQFTVGADALSVSALGRICVAGNSGTHTVKLVRALSKQDVIGGSVSVNMAGCTPGQFRYVVLASPVSLQANTGYYLVSLEAAGGDQWYNWGAVSSTSAASVNNSIWFDGTNWNTVSQPNSSYVPPNFLYSRVNVTRYSNPTSNSRASDIRLGQDGALWFTEHDGNRIGRITTAGVITEYPIPTLNSGPGPITRGPDGALWFTESSGNMIGRITTAGTITEYPIPTANSGPNDITQGPDGALWFIEFNANKIGRITTAGAITEYATNSSPRGIAAGADGALWFTEATKIGRITTTGSITEYPAPINIFPGSITAGPDGALWFTASTNQANFNRIGRISTDGVITHYLVPQSDSTLGRITAGPDGALWFTEGGTADTDNAIGRVTTAGGVTVYYVLTPSTFPFGITPGTDGALWFTDMFREIGRFALVSP